MNGRHPSRNKLSILRTEEDANTATSLRIHLPSVKTKGSVVLNKADCLAEKLALKEGSCTAPLCL